MRALPRRRARRSRWCPARARCSPRSCSPGFPTDRFVFEGFLPREGVARRERIAALVAERADRSCCSRRPTRVRGHAAPTCATACGPLREVAVARELTKLHEEVWRGTLDEAVGHVELTEPRGEHVLVLGARAAGAGGERRRDRRARAAPRSTEGLSPATPPPASRATSGCPAAAPTTSPRASSPSAA